MLGARLLLPELLLPLLLLIFKSICSIHYLSTSPSPNLDTKKTPVFIPADHSTGTFYFQQESNFLLFLFRYHLTIIIHLLKKSLFLILFQHLSHFLNVPNILVVERYDLSQNHTILPPPPKTPSPQHPSSPNLNPLSLFITILRTQS